MTVQPIGRIALALCALASLADGAAAKSAITYPRAASEIPPRFRGAWDELVSDGCEGREARFQLEARDFFNFEVAYDVLKVSLLSPTRIVVHTRLDPQFVGPEDGTWTFRLVRGGNALSGPDGKRPYFGRCRYRLDRHTGSFEPNRHR